VARAFGTYCSVLALLGFIIVYPEVLSAGTVRGIWSDFKRHPLASSLLLVGPWFLTLAVLFFSRAKWTHHAFAATSILVVIFTTALFIRSLHANWVNFKILGLGAVSVAATPYIFVIATFSLNLLISVALGSTTLASDSEPSVETI
jgi:hypothetical protein